MEINGPIHYGIFLRRIKVHLDCFLVMTINADVGRVMCNVKQHTILQMKSIQYY